MARSDIGAPIPDWLRGITKGNGVDWQAEIDAGRRLGLGLLPYGERACVNDRGWYTCSDYTDQPSEVTLGRNDDIRWGWRVGSDSDKRAGHMYSGRYLVVMRPGYDEARGRGPVVGVETLGTSPPLNGRRTWSCGHGRGVEQRCIVCVAFGWHVDR